MNHREEGDETGVVALHLVELVLEPLDDVLAVMGLGHRDGILQVIDFLFVPDLRLLPHRAQPVSGARST